MNRKHKKISSTYQKKLVAMVLSGVMTFAGSFSICTQVFAEDSSGNSKTVSDENITSSISGGSTTSGNASDNTVDISGSNTSINNVYVYGGYTGNGDASKNTINIPAGNINNSKIHVGHSLNGNASGNVLNVYGGNFTGGWLSGAYISGNGTASGNIVNINGGNFSNLSYIEGSWGSGTHTGNIVNIYDGNVNANVISGAWVTSNTTATENAVNISGGTITSSEIAGAYMTSDGNANNNSVSISGGTINGQLQGGYVTGNGNAAGNVINISGGTISGEIVGGYVGGTGEVANNVINIYGNPDLSNATIYAATGSSNITSYGNSINIYTKNITAKNIDGFESLNFYLPSNTQNGDTILTLTDGSSTSARIGEEILYASAGSGGTDLSNTQINVSTSGAVNLQTGDTVTLVRNDNGLLTSDVSNSGTITQGVSVNYDLNLARSADGNSYVATIGERSSELLPQTEAFNSAPIDSVSLLDSGTDRIIEWLPPEEVEMMNNENGKNSMPSTGFDPFGGIGGSVLKLNSGNGSRLENRNGGMNVGMARALKNRHGYLVFGPITDYGQDYFESTLEDGTRGHGQSKYFSAGIIARQMNTGGMYYEGSLRYGRVQTHFSSDNFLVNNIPTHVDYNASTPCYSGHVRVGWRDKVSPNTILDVYGIYSYNKIKGFHTTVSTGEIYNFSSTDSGRIRIGARLTRNIRDLQRLYSGVAFIHEFTGETRGEYLGMETRKSGLKGSSGLVELGWQIKPSKNSAVMLDTSVTAWFGHQKGATFQMKFKREF